MKIEALAQSDDVNKLAEKAVDVHCHGVGRFDFTEIAELNLTEIEAILARRNQHCILTLYLNKTKFDDFLILLSDFNRDKEAGKYPHILGFGLEGPMLASIGGTPTNTVWMPSKSQWKDLSACGKYGLLYIILSPDIELSNNPEFIARNHPNVNWIAEALLEGGVLPAPGHFSKTNPEVSARALKSLFNVVASWGHGPTMTDHLFNDMPHNFKHAWRTPDEKLHYKEDMINLNLSSWQIDNLEEKLGLVPAVMIQNALKGLVKISLNFDGEHVDLQIAKKIVDLIGAQNIMMMTDSIESKRLAGQELHMQQGSTLLYQEDGIVAAGSQQITQQIHNMVLMGLSTTQIEHITHSVPTHIIKKHYEYLYEKRANCI